MSASSPWYAYQSFAVTHDMNPESRTEQTNFTQSLAELHLDRGAEGVQRLGNVSHGCNGHKVGLCSVELNLVHEVSQYKRSLVNTSRAMQQWKYFAVLNSTCHVVWQIEHDPQTCPHSSVPDVPK